MKKQATIIWIQYKSMVPKLKNFIEKTRKLFLPNVESQLEQNIQGLLGYWYCFTYKEQTKEIHYWLI